MLPGWLRLGPTLALVAVLLVSAARAQVRPVLERGREAEVQALFAPYRLGSEVAPGWALWSLGIDTYGIRVQLQGPAPRTHSFELVHPDDAPPEAPRTRSFAVRPVPTDDAQARVAEERLLAAVREHDPGGFWRVSRAPPRPQTGLGPGHRSPDGLLLSGLGLLVIVALALRAAAGAPRWVRWALPVVCAVGVALRLTLTPETVLGAWPWSRLWPNVRWVWEGATLHRLVEWRGATLYLTDLIGWVNLSYALVTPLVLFAHASALMRDTRVAAVAAGIVAVLPQHLRFSHCEDAFVPSIVMSSLAFALLHTWLRDPSGGPRYLSLALLGPALIPGLGLRPLNILFVVVYLAAIFWLHPTTSTRARRLPAAIVVVVAGGLVLHDLVATQGGAVREAAGLGWVLGIPVTLLNPWLNSLLHPGVTPPVLLLLAAFGFHRLRRTGEDRLAWFLVGWLALFFAAHCFVVQESMQPRYLLHLVVPFVLLAAVGVFEVVERSRPAAAVCVAAVALSPATHASFIRGMDYADQVEHRFLTRHREDVPEGCTVVELAAMPHDARFPRLGQRLGGPTDQRFESVPVLAPDADAPPTTLPDAVVELVRAPPACLVIYRGYACAGLKRPDQPIAPACEELLRLAPLELIAQEEAPPRRYDDHAAPGLTPNDRIELSLWRVRPREGQHHGGEGRTSPATSPPAASPPATSPPAASPPAASPPPAPSASGGH